jgi:hypothetical protein
VEQVELVITPFVERRLSSALLPPLRRRLLVALAIVAIELLWILALFYLLHKRT